MSDVALQARERLFGLFAWVCVVFVGLSVGCGKPEGGATGKPQILTRQAVSVEDGMILVDYPGPKGQVLKKDATTDYFCDVPGLINALLDPERTHSYAQAYVQAFDGREWGSYVDGWIEVSRPVYVLGSNQMGAMGPTLVPFAEQETARAFVAKHGGRILRFSELTPDVMAEHARVSRETLRQSGRANPMHSHAAGSHTTAR